MSPVRSLPRGLRELVAVAAAALGLPSCGSDPVHAAPAVAQPHVVLIVVDTLRADHFQHPQLQTPTLDRLAREGVVFPLAFSHTPMTLPAHAALFSSRLPHQTSVVVNGQDVGMEVPLLAEWLQGHGYRTAGVVSIGTLWSPLAEAGVERGFEYYEDGISSFRHLDPAHDTAPRLANALAWLDQGSGPCFLFLHYADPHAPYNAHGSEPLRRGALWVDGVITQPFELAGDLVLQETGVLTPGEHTAQIAVDGGVNVRTLRLTLADGTPLQPTFTEGQLLKRGSSVTVRFTVPGTEEQEVHLASWINDAPRPPQGRQRYAREVEYVDRFLGEAIAELEARGLWDEALVIFTADHGEGLGNHGHFDHVVNLYDELVRVPLAIKLPRGDRRLPELQRAAEGLVRHIDLVPTVLDRLGLPPLPGAMGESLLSAADTERRLIAETHRPDAPRTLFALRDRRHKLIFDPAGDRFELYDTELDPGELSDQFFRDGDQFEAWQAELREIAAQPLTGTERTPEQMESLKALGYLDQ